MNKNDLITAYDLDGYQSRSLAGQFGFYEEQNRKDWSFESRVDSPGDKSLRWVDIAQCKFVKARNPETPTPVTVVAPDQSTVIVPGFEMGGRPNGR